METRSNHILVGGVVLALLAGLVAFIVWLSQVSGDSQQGYDIFFRQSVEGLAKGTAVTYNGVPVGQIEAIDLEERNPEFVRVRIGVGDTTPILQGTTATIRGVGSSSARRTIRSRNALMACRSSRSASAASARSSTPRPSCSNAYRR